MPSRPAPNPRALQRRRPSRCAHLVLLAVTMLLSACSSPSDPVDVLADYNERLGRVLEAALPPVTATRVPTWPAGREITLQPADVRASVFLDHDLGRCGLLREITVRQGLLGRVHNPPQRLLYEMRLLRGLRHCDDVVRDERESPEAVRRTFATTVAGVLELKRRDLPLVYWNATFGAPEMREFFSVGTPPVRLGERAGITDAANAVAWLAALGRQALDAPLPAGEAMEQQYYLLVGDKAGGRLWLTLDLAIRQLDRASLLLELEAAQSRLCPGGIPDLRTQRLQRLYDGVFRARLQPWLADNGADARVLGEALERLWHAQQVTSPPAVSRYRSIVWASAPGSLREEFQQSVQRHGQAWRVALGACLPPG